MDRREYTPTKSSKILSSIGNTQMNTNNKTSLDYSQRQILATDHVIAKDYETLKMQVKQLQYQNRQLSTQAQRLRYEKNIQENKFIAKMNYEEQTIVQFQKEKNYQLQMIKLKQEQDINRIRREYEMKIDDFQRDLKGKDYLNRESTQKSAYLQLKANQLKKGVQNLEIQMIKARQNVSNLSDFLTKEEFKKKKLDMFTNELQNQKCEMESQIRILLDIEAEKSRSINALEVQIKNSEAKGRSLRQKLATLTENFTILEEHIALMKDRLLSSDKRNEELEQQFQSSEQTLSIMQENVNNLKDQQIRFRQDLQKQQARQNRREKHLSQLITENERLIHELNFNKEKLHQMCISQGIEI